MLSSGSDFKQFTSTNQCKRPGPPAWLLWHLSCAAFRIYCGFLDACDNTWLQSHRLDDVKIVVKTPATWSIPRAVPSGSGNGATKILTSHCTFRNCTKLRYPLQIFNSSHRQAPGSLLRHSFSTFFACAIAVSQAKWQASCPHDAWSCRITLQNAACCGKLQHNTQHACTTTEPHRLKFHVTARSL